MISPAEMAERLTAFTQALNNGDAVACAALFAADAAAESAMGAKISGRSGVAELFRRTLAAFPDLKVEPLKVLYPGPGRAITEFTLSGTMRGTLETADGQKFPPTGKVFRVQGVTNVQFNAAGEIALYVNRIDNAQWLSQLGIVPPLTITADGIKAQVEKLVAAANSRDAAAVAACYTEDCVIGSPVLGEQRGRAAVQQNWERILKSYPDMEAVAQSIEIDGNTAVTTLQVRGTNRGPLTWREATGRRVELTIVSVSEISALGIVSERAYLDNLAAARQLGLV